MFRVSRAAALETVVDGAPAIRRTGITMNRTLTPSGR